ncbi:MAG: permease-like cell division protein FtsX [bacterium]|nr:permease-like cell division protein FtsX [bacterium]
MTVLRRIIKAGFVNFSRNGLVSWAAVLVTTITLLVITSLLFLQVVLRLSLDQIKDKVDVTIYFTVDAPEDKIMVLRESLLKLPEVEDVSYTSAEENLRNFRERHTNDYSEIQALDELGFNPLEAYLGVKAKEISQYASIANFINSDDSLMSGPGSMVREVNYHKNKEIIEKLNAIITGAQKLGFLTTLVLIVISIIITFNTIRLTIFISKEEIGVMRLVGASKTRVQGPFMIEGAIYGAVATVLTILIFWPATAWLGRNMTEFLGIDLYKYFFSNFIQIFLIVLLSGMILGISSSFLAVRKYLDR